MAAWQLKHNHIELFYALQTTFFIVFGRLFDVRRDVLSVHKLVNDTIERPGYFSKAALRERKRNASSISGPDPNWLIKYVKDAWEPTRAGLLPLKVSLAPKDDKFRTIYQPIRHRYFAHRGMDSEEAIHELFGRTLIGDVAEILRFLHTLQWAITEMAWNARQPDLTDFHEYDSYIKEISEKAEQLIRQMP